MNSLNFLHGELERNWACQDSPYYENRKANIGEMRHPLQRLGENIMLGLARMYPKAVGAVIARHTPDMPGWALAGSGSEHTVISNGERVTKIHRMSVFMTPAERVALSESMSRDHTILRNYLGGIVLPQESYIGNNPLNHRRQAVLTKQKCIDFVNPGLFYAYISPKLIKKPMSRLPKSSLVLKTP